MSSDALANPVVELAVDGAKLKDSIKDALADVEKLGKNAEESFKSLSSLGIGKAVSAAKAFNQQIAEGIKNQKKFTSGFSDALRKSGETAFTKLRDSFKANLAKIQEGLPGAIGTAAKIGGIGVAAGTGAVFAGAAAAGSTTLDTLTGSIRMLALAAGEKTQNSILKLADIIQGIADRVEKMPAGNLVRGGGALGGAALGFGIAGPLGAGVGALGGLAGGELLNNQVQADEQRQILQAQIRKIGKPEALRRAALLEQQGEEVHGFFERLGKGEALFGDTAEARRAKGAAQMIREAAEGEPAVKAGLRAGLNRPASFSALGDVRMEGQLAGFGKGPLDIANELKELNLNLKALTGVNREIVDNSKKPDQDQHNAPN